MRNYLFEKNNFGTVSASYRDPRGLKRFPLHHENGWGLGRNLRVAFLNLFGLTFEDAYAVSDKLVRKGMYDSIHVETISVPVLTNSFGSEKVTREVINASRYDMSKLDADGVVIRNSFVRPGDILVSKISPVSKVDDSPEQKFLLSLLGEKNIDVRNTMVRLPAEFDRGGFVRNIRYVKGRFGRGEFKYWRDKVYAEIKEDYLGHLKAVAVKEAGSDWEERFNAFSKYTLLRR